MESVFSSKKNHPYLLHAILIHEGFAESGHYYAFILDRANNQWWRFNDHSITKEHRGELFMLLTSLDRDCICRGIWR